MCHNRRVKRIRCSFLLLLILFSLISNLLSLKLICSIGITLLFVSDKLLFKSKLNFCWKLECGNRTRSGECWNRPKTMVGLALVWIKWRKRAQTKHTVKTRMRTNELQHAKKSDHLPITNWHEKDKGCQSALCAPLK